MFVVAPDMRKEMRVFASVDEADIGLIRAAQKTGQPVRFTVDAHPDDLFTGTIFQIRQNATTNQNVVTYPVVVSAPNPDLKLLPQMTASLSFQVGAAKNVLADSECGPAVLSRSREQVRPEDRKLLEIGSGPAPDDQDRSDANLSADDKAETRRRRNRRHVWVVDGEFLRAIPVNTGLERQQEHGARSGRLA